jgi:hypothetical protein
MVTVIRSGALPAHRATADQVRLHSARPWEATGAVDVEALAVWAYRDQMVDRFATVGLHALEAGVDGYLVRGRSADGCAAIADINHMGCRIDYSGRIVRDTVHRAAEEVAAVLSTIAGGRTVAFHARLGGRPDGWASPKRWWRAAVWEKPWQVAQWERTGPGNSPRYCPIIQVMSREELGRRRLDYQAWWDALDELRWSLSARNLGFTVTGPAAPREPWGAAAEGQPGAPPYGSSPGADR